MAEFIQYMTYSNIMMSVLLLSGLYTIYKVKTSKEEFSLSDIFIKDAKRKFEVVATLTTGFEVVGLSLVAIERGVEPFNAYSRYITIGFIELMFTFLFINSTLAMIRAYLKKAYADNKMSWIEAIGYPCLFLITVFPLWVLCSIPTYIISNLYFESIGVLKFNYTAHWHPLYYVEPASVATTTYDAEGNKITIYPELGALIMIWFTPILNAMQLLFSPVEMIKEAGALAKERRERADSLTGKSMGLDTALEHVDRFFKFTPDLIKFNIDRLTDPSNPKCHPDISGGKVSPAVYKKTLIDSIIGKVGTDPAGVVGILEISHEVDKINELERPLIENIDAYKKQIATINAEIDKVDKGKHPDTIKNHEATIEGLKAKETSDNKARELVRQDKAKFMRKLDTLKAGLKRTIERSGLIKDK